MKTVGEIGEYLRSQVEHLCDRRERLAGSVLGIDDHEHEHQIADLDCLGIPTDPFGFSMYEVGALAKCLIVHPTHRGGQPAQLAYRRNDIQVVRVFRRQTQKSVATAAEQDRRMRLLNRFRPTE